METLSWGRLFRGIALAVGLLLLVDSLSQLIQAANALDLGNRTSRLANLRLLFTQVTPLTLGLLLTGQYVVRSESGWRKVGWVTLTLGVVIALLATAYAVDAAALGGTLSGPPLGQLKRGSVQVLASGGAFALALLVVGGKALKRP